MAVQRCDQRAVFIGAICCWSIGTVPRCHLAAESQRDQEGPGDALVGQVPIVQDRYEEWWILFTALQSQQVLPICVISGLGNQTQAYDRIMEFLCPQNIYSSSLVVILHFITYCSARRRRRWFLSSFFHMSNMGLWAGRQAKWDPLESRWFDLILLHMYDSMSVLAFKSSFVLSVKNIFGG